MELGMGKKGVPSFAKGIHVLVVDHDQHSLQSISSLLQNFSFKVTTSEEAGAALTMIMEEKNEPFNLVMANATESNMNALSFLHQIGIPIILMASDTDMKTAGKAVADWSCHFLEKPISIEDVDLVWQVAYRKIRNPRAMNLQENANQANKCQFDGTIGKIMNVARGVERKSIEENANQAKKSQIDGSIGRIVKIARGVEWKSIEENANQAQNSQIDGSISRIVNVVEWKSIEENANQAQKYQNDGSISRIVNVARGVEWKSIEENANQSHKSQIDGTINRIVNVEWKSFEENANQAQKSQIDGSIRRIVNVASGVKWKPIEEQVNGGDRGITETRLKPSATVFDHLETTKMNAEGNRNERTNKRSRIVWSSRLHRKFTEALSKLGNRKSSPKIILKMMNEPSLTLRQVASHLQKFKSQVKHLNKITASDASTSLSRNQLQQLPAKLNTNILGQPNYSSNITDNLTQLQAPSCLNGPSPRLPSQAVNCYLRVTNPNSSNSYKTTHHSDSNLHPDTYGGFEGGNVVEDNYIFTDELFINESSEGFAQTSHFNLQYFGADDDCPFLSADNHYLDAVQELEFAQNLPGCLDFDKLTSGAHSVTAGLLNQNVALKELDNLLNNTEEDPMVCCRYGDEMNSFDIDQYSEWLNA